MRALQSDSYVEDGGLTPEILQARLTREKLARVEAERLLEEKSRELYSTNQVLQKVADAVESQRVQLDAILENTSTGIVLANSELGLTRANRKAIILFDLGIDYFAEDKVQDLFDNFETVRPIFEQRVQDSRWPDDTMHESVGKRADGSTFPLEFGLNCIELDGRQLSVWIFRDISKRKREEAKRQTLERELSQAQKMEALGTLASGVAHEINTPIQYISDNLRFLQDSFSEMSELIDIVTKSENSNGLFDAFVSKAEEIDLEFLKEEAPLSIQQSLDGIKQVASIVNAIKEFSHPGSDEKAEFDLNKLIETTLTVTRNQWKYVADVKTELHEEVPLVKGHSSDINQVLLNLVVNAADAIASSDRDEMGKISISTKALKDRVQIIVSDNGSGMPNDVRQRIFDPFYTTKAVGKGTGQGLAIAYSIIKQKHNGSIECDSLVGVGTTFTIDLPLEQSEELE